MSNSDGGKGWPPVAMDEPMGRRDMSRRPTPTVMSQTPAAIRLAAKWMAC